MFCISKKIFLFNSKKVRWSSVDKRLIEWEKEFTLQSKIQILDIGKPINITLPNGSVVVGERGITTPRSIAHNISPSLAKQSIVAEGNNGVLIDMSTPLVKDTTLTFLKFDSEQGKLTLWHSAAHILGQAIEKFYNDKGGVSLADGPPLLNHQSGGFFYEFLLHEADVSVVPEHKDKILEICQQIIKEKQEFQKLYVTRERAKEFFASNKLKLQLIDKIPEYEPISIYKCGPFVDLCRGPHISNTSDIPHFDLITFASSVGWEGSEGVNHKFQRIYGIAFQDKKLLANWKNFREEAMKRDHRLIGKQQQLFMMSPLSPGSVFFLPMGTRIYNKLISFIKTRYVKYGFQEVITPLLFNDALWKKSGHWDHYKKDMFFIQNDEDSKNTQVATPENDNESQTHSHHHHNCGGDSMMGLKPMNCPAHCLIFSSQHHSYQDLPIKYADFSPLHRHEASGALRGLTRVRRFVQDDAHIFCRFDQIKEMISECLEFLDDVYKALGFKYRVVLSTRPVEFMGSVEKWDQAEHMLSTCLQERNMDYQINPQDGAFYGPKIDILIKDAIEREHQCGTIQLDFQLPERFELSYQNNETKSETPILIHRAMLGSIERIFAVLIEHNAGKWPFWLSPRQAIICTVSPDCVDYAKSVFKQIQSQSFFVETNFQEESIEKKIRSAQLEQFNYILVIGRKERDSQTVNVRTRDNQVHGTKKVEEILEEWKIKQENYE